MAEMDVHKLIVNNLPADFTSDSLNDLMGRYGAVRECDCKWSIGFAGFEHYDDALAAYQDLNGQEFEGKVLSIQFPGYRAPVSRLIVKNLPTVDFSQEEFTSFFRKYGKIRDCIYKWGYGFVQYEKEEFVEEAISQLRGHEIEPGRKILFEVQGPDGSVVQKKGATIGEEDNEEDDGGIEVGQIRLFLANLPDPTTPTALKELCDPFGKIKKVNVKNNFGFVTFESPQSCKKAYESLLNTKMKGRSLSVQYAEIKRGGKLWISNLKIGQKRREVLLAFSKFGDIVEFKMYKGFAFITYDHLDSTKRAVVLMDRTVLGGNKIKVQHYISDQVNIADADADGCSNCGSPGHVSKFCPYFRQKPCTNCGDRGHGPLDCSASRPRSRSPTRRRREDAREDFGYRDGHLYGRR